jgi:hypothetical protein
MRGLVQFPIALVLLNICILPSPTAASLATEPSADSITDSSSDTNSSPEASESSVEEVPPSSRVKSDETASSSEISQSHSPTITDESSSEGNPSSVMETPVANQEEQKADSDSHQPGPVAAPLRDDFTGADDAEDVKADMSAVDDGEEEESSDATSGVVKQLLNHLFGEAIDTFSTSESLNKMKGTMTIDCSTRADDADAKFNIVTTLCPILRPESPCGRIRHPSYEIEDEEAVCSANCRPHINDLIRALPNRGTLSHKHEGVIFRDVVNSIIHQYCSICRTGCIL